MSVDVKKTSLVHALGIFERFLQGVMEENPPAEGTLSEWEASCEVTVRWCPTHLNFLLLDLFPLSDGR